MWTYYLCVWLTDRYGEAVAVREGCGPGQQRYVDHQCILVVWLHLLPSAILDSLVVATVSRCQSVTTIGAVSCVTF